MNYETSLAARRADARGTEAPARDVRRDGMQRPVAMQMEHGAGKPHAPSDSVSCLGLWFVA